MKQPDCSHYIKQEVVKTGKNKGKTKLKVCADQAFISLYPDFSQTSLISDVSKHIADEVLEQSKQKFNKTPTDGAINNCKGLWNEMAFLYRAHSSILTHTKNLYIVKMGNESSVKFWEIYDDKSRCEFENIILKLKNKGIFIRCSTPDFVVINRDFLQNIPDKDQLDSQTFYEGIKNFHKTIIKKCPASKVIGFVSLKTSNRPDRRYQILYEANVTKYAAQYIHKDGKRLRFDSIGKSNDSDIEVFNAPLLHELPRLVIEDFEDQLKLFESPIINSDTTIKTQKDLDNYWNRFLT